MRVVCLCIIAAHSLPTLCLPLIDVWFGFGLWCPAFCDAFTGHDGHVSTLLCVARIAAGMRDQFSGVIKFMFQPGEEGKAGAKLMIADGVLDGGAESSGGSGGSGGSADGKCGPRVDEVYGLHYVGLVSRARSLCLCVNRMRIVCSSLLRFAVGVTV